MNLSRTALAAVALLATAALPASAGGSPTVWLPSHVDSPFTHHDAVAAFPGGAGWMAGPTNPGVAGTGAVPRHTALFRTTDSGRTWRPVLPGVPAQHGTSVAFASPTEVWAYGANTLSRSTDTAATWAPAATLPLPAGEELRLAPGGFSISRDGAAMALAGGVTATSGTCFGDAGTAFLWSDDGGATWEETRFPATHTGTGLSVRSVEAVDADTGIVLATEMNATGGCTAYGEGRDVYLTNDAGATWTKVAESVSSSSWIESATVTGTGRVVLGWDDGTVQVSDDGGVTFTAAQRLDSATEVDLPPVFHADGFDRVTDVAFAGSTGYATQDSGIVWRTTDNGTTWARDGVAGSTAVLAGLLGVFDADRAFAVGTGLVFSRVA